MKITNKAGLPEPIVKAATPRDRVIRKDVFYVTELVDSPRIKKLQDDHWPQLEEDASDRIWAILGSAVHGVLEKNVGKDELSEKRVEVEIDGCKVTGRMDLYNPETGTLTDYKFVGVASVFNGLKPEWEKQLWLYAWMLQKTGHKVTSIKVTLIFRDWKRMLSMKDPSYPQTQVVTMTVSLPPMTTLEAYAKERVALHKAHAERVKGYYDPCTDPERWTKPTTFAVMKGTNKKASRVLPSAKEAEAWKAAQEKPGLYNVVHRPGEDTRCLYFCPVRMFCDHGQRLHVSDTSQEE